jgi:mannose-6-phosphate isomerase-like protein (cupin superfamily)
MELRDRIMPLSDGELIIVPRGVEHRPVARREVHVLLLEPASTVNTGNVSGERAATPLGRGDEWH